MGALDEFRAQREAADEVRARLSELTKLLGEIRTKTDTLVRDDRLARLLEEERQWLRRAETVVEKAQAFRQWEGERFWPAVWRRWFVAVGLVCATGFFAAAGCVWVSRGHQQELEALRQKHQVLDAIADRVLEMSPTERQQFDALMRPRGRSR